MAINGNRDGFNRSCCNGRIVMDVNHIDNDFLSNIQHHLHKAFQTSHSKIQVETLHDKSHCLLHGDPNPMQDRKSFV